MYTNRTYDLAFKTGDYVDTPIQVVGYVTSIEAYGVLVRIPCKGRVDPRCITPKASNDSLWVFQHGEITKTNPPKERLWITSETSESA